MEKRHRRDECQQHRRQERHYTEEPYPPPALPHALKVHLQSREEHYVEQSHPSEQLEGVVADEDVQSVFADDNAGEHHANEVWYAQLPHDYRREEDNQHDDKEDQCRVCNWEVL